jgi:hypothetical protein
MAYSAISATVPKRFLVGAQHAHLVPGLALQRQHHVHKVFEHLGPGDEAVLGDVAHEDHRYAAFLGQSLEVARRGAHLGRRAGHRVALLGDHGLDGVDHRHRRGGALQVVHHRLHRSLRQQHQAVADAADALGAQGDLAGALLAADVDRGFTLTGHGRRHLQQQRRLAHARFAGEEYQGSRNQPAAEHTVEAGQVGGAARFHGRGGLAHRNRLHRLPTNGRPAIRPSWSNRRR